ncbi:MAG: helix-turn-helix domain-containing protein [Candidatus Omnitrophica bacterium]|nr:helix-turn-helix domain-containing protein [Candidatus Omnitrophota bacterium]
MIIEVKKEQYFLSKKLSSDKTGIKKWRFKMTLVTAKAISEKYSIPLGTIYYYISRNEIPHYQIMGRRKFNPLEIESWVRQGKSNVAAKVW